MARRVFAFILIAYTSGCTVSHVAARRIVAAPNQFPSNLNKKLEKTWNWAHLEKTLFSSETNCSLLRATIPVGPPSAKLSAIIFPPHDYKMKVASRLSESADGKKKVLSLKVSKDTNSLFNPLQTPSTIVVLHGYSMTKESMAPWALILAQAGYRVVLVDLRGHGRSTGWRISFGKNESADLAQMLDWLIARNMCDEQVGVLGLSYGGTLALHWAARDSRVRTVVAIAPYNRADDAMKAFATEAKMSISKAAVESATALVEKKYEVDWTMWSGEAAVQQLKQPTLFVAGTDDRICRLQEIEKLQQAAPKDSEIIKISEANHLAIGFLFHDLSEPVKSWFGKHLNSKAVAEKEFQQKTSGN